jgi:hypothetical protein
MSMCDTKRVAMTVPVLLWLSSCVPRNDLDATASGHGTGGTGTTEHASGGRGGATTTLDNGSGSGGTTPAESAQAGGTSSSVSAAAGAAAGGTHDASVAVQGGSVATTASSIGSGGAIQVTSGEPGLGGAALSRGGTVATSSSGNPLATAGARTTATTSTSGGSASNGGTASLQGGTSSGGAKTGGAAGVAPDLPELTNVPITGKISYSSTAGWEVDKVQRESFRIETPTATYFVVKSSAAIPSLVDQNNVLWLNFSSGFRPYRGIPNLGSCCQVDPPDGSDFPVMTTVLDERSLTSTHLRLISKSADGSAYWLVWDFYLTHLTVTVNHSEKPYGFTFYGMPGNALDSNDELVLSTGEHRRADIPFSGDLPGPVEWAYIANPETGKNGSLFLIQHGDDEIPENFSNPDADSVRFTFGSGQIVTTPKRFSIGLINSVDSATVTQRINYVANSIPAL